MTETVTLLRSAGPRMSKHWNADGTIAPYDKAQAFTLTEREVSDVESLSTVLADVESDPRACVVRGKWKGVVRASADDGADYTPGKVRRAIAQFDDRPLHVVMIDVDKFEPLSCDPVAMPEVAISEFILCCLPGCFWARSHHWQLSSSAGSAQARKDGFLKAHLWFWLDEPLDSDTLRAWGKTVPGVDVALFNRVQVHYTALPTFAPGVVDPVPRRSGFTDGLAGDTVPLRVDAAVLAEAAQTSATQRHVVLRGVVESDPIARALSDAGLVLSQARSGELNIVCPFVGEHGDGTGGAETSTQYFPAHTRGYAKGNFKCLHAHCVDRKRGEWLGRLGLDEDGSALNADDFGAVPEDDETEAIGGAEAIWNRDALPPLTVESDDVGSIPDAKHLCTDQANSNRVIKRFNGRVIVAGGAWYYWSGSRWREGDRGAYTNACKLSAIVRSEANAWRAKTASDDAEKKKNDAIAEGLDKWSTKCEMKATIEAAIGLVKKTISVDVAALDRDPWLLNCLNGTVDLRTGELRAHRPADFITKLAKVKYRADAQALMWERVLAQITLEWSLWGDAGGPLAAFLQRWFGYCATGIVREQVFVVHHGDGSNGKSTVLDVMAAALGDYAGAAAPGLLSASRNERHPTEIADLHGKRMVTAHETGEGCVLREDFIKQATGGDVLKARVMRGDFFDFAPTHKLQLLTNHKPIIKGQDAGIWRRVLLVPYLARFGSGAALAAGDAHFPKDLGLMAKLLSVDELEGVLAWVVRGAVIWAAEGLQPPDSVLSASRSYQGEQDRIGAFVREYCETGAECHEPLSGGMGGGLYPAYVGWCKEGGILALSRQRFLQELERAVPNFAKRDEKHTTGELRRTVTMIYGLQLLPAE